LGNNIRRWLINILLGSGWGFGRTGGQQQAQETQANGRTAPDNAIIPLHKAVIVCELAIQVNAAFCQASKG